MLIENLSELISFTARKARKFHNREAQCILYFAQHPDTGISDFRKSLQADIYDKKRKCYNKPYRGNLVKVAKKLEDEEILESMNEKGPKYYHITDYGIYCLLYQKNILKQVIIYLLCKNGNIIFESFLSPVFDQTTLQSLILHADIICRYLIRCFQDIQMYQHNMKFKISKKLFEWEQIPPGRSRKLKEFHDLRNFLQNELQLGWMKSATIEKLNGDKAVRIFHKNDSLIIRISENKQKAILGSNAEWQYTFHISCVVGPNNRRETNLIATLSPEEFAVTNLDSMIKINTKNLIEELFTEPLNYFEKLQLAKDAKFRGLIKPIRQSLKTKLDILNQLEKQE